jgi:type VI secretion system secreted protein Hcp
MSVQIVLKLEDAKGPINGESIVGKGTKATHENEIDVISWSWGITQTGSAHIGSGGGAGSADVHDLTVVKYVDKASPLLASACFNGSHLKKATLTCIKVAGGDPGKPKTTIDFVKVTMTGTVMISSFSPGGSGSDDRFTETVTIHFSDVEYDYTGQKADQTPDTPVLSGAIHVGT